MPIYEIEFEAKGRASVEADDEAEAEDLVKEAVEDFDTMQLESFEVDEVDITDVSK